MGPTFVLVSDYYDLRYICYDTFFKIYHLDYIAISISKIKDRWRHACNVYVNYYLHKPVSDFKQ